MPLASKRRGALAVVALAVAFFASSVGAYGILAWTAAVHGAAYDPDAFPGITQLGGSRVLALDAAGNAYVAGTCRNGLNGGLLTVKYGADGAVRWRAFAGATVGSLQGSWSGIAPDAQGNVYVTGYDLGGPSSQARFVTIKYDADGAEVWRAFDAEPNYAYADTVAVDPGGNPLVAGRVLVPLPDPGTFRIDYLTIKYDAAGAEEWRATVSNASSSIQTSNVTSLFVDAAGNVYLAGATDAADQLGYLAVGYDAGGNERWRAAPKVSATSQDYLYGAAGDASGNVYLTGLSFDGNSYRPFTIVYDANGVEKWRSLGAFLEQSNAIVVDGAGSVYTAGTAQNAGTGTAIVTKYSANGVAQWRASSVANGSLNPYSVAVDAAGAVYATGTMYDATGQHFWTAKYDPTGVEQWRRMPGGVAGGLDYADAVKIDASGNAYVAGSADQGSGNHDWVLIKYNAGGAEQWRANEGVAWTDTVIAAGNTWTGRQGMAADGDGNVYLAGYVEPVDFHDGVDFLTVKLAPGGTELWRASPGAAPAFRAPRALTVDASGSVYVTGTSGDGDNRSYFTIKYGSSGQEAWRTVSQNASGSSADDPTAIAVDALHNVYVTGTSYHNDALDYFTIKYDANGVEQWRRPMHDPLDGNYFPDAVAADAAGNVYVTGFGGVPGGTDCLTISYDPIGSERWRATCNDATTHYTDIRSMRLDRFGNVYVAGSSYGPDGYGFVTIKYSSGGVRQWRSIGVRGDYRSSYAFDLAVDAAGNAYVLGSSGTGSNYDYLTIKYDSNGVEQWRAFVADAIDWYAGPNAVAVDGAGNVYVTGAILDGETGRYITLKYDPAGTELWRRLSHSPARDDEFTTSVALAAGNAVYVAGQSFGPTAPPYMIVEKLVEGLLPSVTAVVSDPDPSLVGQIVTFSASVAGYQAKGTMSFSDGASPIPGCSAVAMVGSLASCKAVLGTAGTHSIFASYSGDVNNAASTSTALSQKVLTPTATTLTSTPNPAVLSQLVSLTATITPSAATGVVDFREGGATICSGVAVIKTRTGKAATCSSAGLSVGAHAIVAVYSGDAAFAASTSAPLAEIVTFPPAGVALKSSQNPSAPNASVTFTATVTGQTPSGTVNFRDGTDTMCSAAVLQGGGNSPSATCVSPPLKRGAHPITAQYSGDPVNPAATSPVFSQTVKRLH